MFIVKAFQLKILLRAFSFSNLFLSAFKNVFPCLWILVELLGHELKFGTAGHNKFSCYEAKLFGMWCTRISFLSIYLVNFVSTSAVLLKHWSLLDISHCSKWVLLAVNNYILVLNYYQAVRMMENGCRIWTWNARVKMWKTSESGREWEGKVPVGLPDPD